MMGFKVSAEIENVIDRASVSEQWWDLKLPVIPEGNPAMLALANNDGI